MAGRADRGIAIPLLPGPEIFCSVLINNTHYKFLQDGHSIIRVLSPSSIRPIRIARQPAPPRGGLGEESRNFSSMQPFGPLSPRPHPTDFQALFLRNQLRPPEAEPPPRDTAEVEDRVELRSPGQDEIRRKQEEEKARGPKAPQAQHSQLPQPRPLRPITSGWIMSESRPKKGASGERSLEEEDLAQFSRWRGPVSLEQAAESGWSLQELWEGQQQPGPVGRLAQLLLPLGAGIWEQCHHYGLRLCLQAEPTHYARRLLAVSQADLENPSPTSPSPIGLAMAMAYDEALGQGEPASRNSLAVLSWCKGSESPQSLFARSLCLYLEERLSPSEALHDYVEYLVKKSRSLSQPRWDP